MSAIQFLMLSLVVAGFTALVIAIVRRTWILEKRQFEKGLHAREVENGNRARSVARVTLRPVTTPGTNKR